MTDHSQCSAGSEELVKEANEHLAFLSNLTGVHPHRIARIREALRTAQPQKSAVISAADWERVFQDACDEAGCEYDNEALLSSIANLTSYVDMLWAWFRERRGSEDMRANVANGGLSADDFKQMLDDHEANLIPAQPQEAPNRENLRPFAEWADRNRSAVSHEAADELILLARKACDAYGPLSRPEPQTSPMQAALEKAERELTDLARPICCVFNRSTKKYEFEDEHIAKALPGTFEVIQQIRAALSLTRPEPQAAPHPTYDAEAYEGLPLPLELEISGPYKYQGDSHPCFVLRAQHRVFAAVYIIDEDEDRARREAELIQDVMRMGRIGLDKLHYAYGTSSVSRPEPQPPSKTPADELVAQIEERFPNWRSYRDLLDCIDCTLHQLRAEAQP